jgi:HEAT repeat protein
LGTVPGSTPALADALAREKDARVREAILTSLSHTREGLAIVLPYVRSDEAEVRTAALDALRSAAAAIEPLLEESLHDPDPDVRLLICDVVRALPSTVATRLMVELLDREQAVNVCGAALEVLAEVGEPSAVPALDRCAGRFPDEPFLLFSARLAAQRITGPRG